MKRILGRNDMEDGLRRLDTLTKVEVRMVSAQLALATHPADNRVRVMVDNVVSVDSRGRGVRSRQATIDDNFARVIIGVQPSSISCKGCFDHDTPRWK
jgi:hypothetical protein